MQATDLIKNPRRALFGQLTLYYLALGLLYLVLVLFVPDVSSYFYQWRGDDPYEGVLDQLAPGNTFRIMQAETMLSLAVSMVGALALMLPITWIYMGTRRRRGIDQSLVETLLMLPLAVSGVIVIVQDSLALAFSLAGIFAGIQFRSRLKYYADAHFLFASIGVGLAAGIGALHIAAVMSVVFNYTAYLLWRTNYGADAGERHLRYASDVARNDAHLRKAERDERHQSDDSTST